MPAVTRHPHPHPKLQTPNPPPPPHPRGSSCTIRRLVFCDKQGLCSLISGKTSYLQISWSVKASKLYVIMNVSLWSLKRFEPEFHGIETSWDLAVKRPSVKWIEAQNPADNGKVNNKLGLLTFLKTNHPLIFLNFFKVTTYNVPCCKMSKLL